MSGLDLEFLKKGIANAFEASQLDPTEDSQKTLAGALALVIYLYIRGANVNTTITAVANGGKNTSVITPGGPVPGVITEPATVSGTGTGKLS